jgi:hypothetical protein
MEDFTVKSRRTRILIGTIIAVMAFMAAGFAINSRTAKSKLLAYESLQEGMSVEAVSNVLQRDVSKDLSLFVDISGIRIDEWLETEWAIIPQAEIRLFFSCGRLIKKERNEFLLSGSWRVLVYQGKKLIGW